MLVIMYSLINLQFWFMIMTIFHSTFQACLLLTTSWFWSTLLEKAHMPSEWVQIHIASFPELFNLQLSLGTRPSHACEGLDPRLSLVPRPHPYAGLTGITSSVSCCYFFFYYLFLKWISLAPGVSPRENTSDAYFPCAVHTCTIPLFSSQSWTYSG